MDDRSSMRQGPDLAPRRSVRPQPMRLVLRVCWISFIRSKENVQTEEQPVAFNTRVL